MFRKLALFLLTVSVLCSVSTAETSISIGNLPTSSNITRQEVVLFYTLKYKTWHDGNPVIIVILPDTSSEHADFVRGVLGISVNQYRRLLDNSINSGGGGNLIKVNSLTDMIKKVETTPYSLGYVNKDFLVLRGAEKNVKVLRIID